MSSDVLRRICATKQEHVVAQMKVTSLAQLEEAIAQAHAPRGFLRALQEKSAHKQVGLIAELKKASPSKGLIRPNFVPRSLARAYFEGGATCLSVLTDEPYFQGKNVYLQEAKESVVIPILRKDFMLQPWQIYESRAIGADCILLIMAALSDSQAAELEQTAFDLGMDVLVEVHSEDEMERALRLQSPLIGVNNRDLKTLKIDMDISKRVLPMLPKEDGYLGVCESGIYSREDVERMQEQGVYCFLVGESLMRQEDVVKATSALVRAA